MKYSILAIVVLMSGVVAGQSGTIEACPSKDGMPCQSPNYVEHCVGCSGNGTQGVGRVQHKTICVQCDRQGPHPEPMDVPAIIAPVTRKEILRGECDVIGDMEHGARKRQGEFTLRQKSNLDMDDIGDCTFRWDTCADKSRILLTDESGGKHCIKFPKEQP